MSNMGANVAIIDGDRILLTKREDFEVWCLPGGMTDQGESLAGTARREAREETGLEVELERLVGVYSRLGGWMDLHGALFVGHIVAGELAPQADEVIDTGWFTLDELPDDIFWWHVPQIRDALTGKTGVASVAHFEPRHPVASRKEVYAMRDAMTMSRTEFYRYFFEYHGNDRYTREVGD